MNRKNNVRIATFLLMLGAFQANAQQTVSLKNAIQYGRCYKSTVKCP